MKTRAPYRRRIAARTVACLAMAMVGSIGLPGPARSGQEADDSAADAVVRGPLGKGVGR